MKTPSSPNKIVNPAVIVSIVTIFLIYDRVQYCLCCHRFQSFRAKRHQWPTFQPYLSDRLQWHDGLVGGLAGQSN